MKQSDAHVCAQCRSLKLLASQVGFGVVSGYNHMMLAAQVVVGLLVAAALLLYFSVQTAVAGSWEHPSC